MRPIKHEQYEFIYKVASLVKLIYMNLCIHLSFIIPLAEHCNWENSTSSIQIQLTILTSKLLSQKNGVPRSESSHTRWGLGREFLFRQEKNVLHNTKTGNKQPWA